MMTTYTIIMNNQQYIDQVTLLLKCLPALKSQNSFALKGGTAINFFIRNLPRLSVDIDLTYIKSEPRTLAIKNIEKSLTSLGESITELNSSLQTRELRTKNGTLHKLLIKDGQSSIKIEPNLIMRKTLLPITHMNLTEAIKNKFAYHIKDIPVLAEEELFAGKICAALSRQHPRDFFDIMMLLKTQGITDRIRKAFVIYLLCSPRPIHELLNPNLINLEHVYTVEFMHMTETHIPLKDLLNTRLELIQTIEKTLTDNEKEFILSVKKGSPNYSLMPYNDLETFPALQWKLFNIQKMSKEKHLKMLKALTHVLER